jgi:hypothetical protein
MINEFNIGDAVVSYEVKGQSLIPGKNVINVCVHYLSRMASRPE